SQFPKKNNFQSNAGGGLDAFVAKFNPAASGSASLLFASWLGGVDDERATAIALDASTNIYITGQAFSCDPFASGCNPVTNRFPLVNALQRNYGGGDGDAFVAKIPA